MEHVGTKLRELRRVKNLSLKQLAHRSGCSSSYLSMIENGKVDPGISRLKKIADGLEVTLVDLFQNQSDAKVVIRKYERIQGEFRGSRTKIQILVPQIPGKQMDARLAIVSPGGGSEGDYQHPGEEFGLVLAGSLRLTVGGATYHLAKDDSFYFSSTQSHSFENAGDEDAIVVWVNHPASW
jgi:transcriptional regulator with XRE-family HTH domain